MGQLIPSAVVEMAVGRSRRRAEGLSVVGEEAAAGRVFVANYLEVSR